MLLRPQLAFSMLRMTETDSLRMKLKTQNFKCTLMLSCLKIKHAIMLAAGLLATSFLLTLASQLLTWKAASYKWTVGNKLLF